jgi:tetratricopeptide (TPR) repeat protein
VSFDHLDREVFLRTEIAATRSTVVLCLLAAGVVASSCASEPPAAETNDLGTVDFRVSCEGSEDAFDRAVALLHHMTYPQAREAFEEIAESAPDCAIAHWGIASTLFQPLWPNRPTEADLARGWQEVQRAKELGAPTARERGFIDVAEAFFDPAAGDYWARIGRWEAAARDLHARFPDDHEAAVYYALAHLAAAPASGGTEHQDAAAEILGRVLAKQPMHPGAVHYTIHANDVAGREAKSPEVVRRYLEIAPHNPHALHMPTHIFTRRGEWADVIEWNRQAAEAALEHPAGDEGQWVWDEFPHALEYLVYAHLQRGDDAAALEAMRRLENTQKLQPSLKTAFNLSSIPVRYALERKAWSEAAGLPARPGATALPWDRFPWPEAVTWYARGVGAIRSGNPDGGVEAEARLNVLRGVAEQAGEELFARQIEVLRLQVAAWLAHSGGDDGRAVQLMRAAANLEAATPKHAVTPAPTLPALEVLGDLFMEMGRSSEALEAYRAALASAPGRFNSLAGAARAARSAGDTAVARDYYRQLQGGAVADSPRPELAEAIAFSR